MEQDINKYFVEALSEYFDEKNIKFEIIRKYTLNDREYTRIKITIGDFIFNDVVENLSYRPSLFNYIIEKLIDEKYEFYD